MTPKSSEFGSPADRTGGPSTADPDRPLPAGVHVWVRSGSQEVPGLLAGWRQAGDGWWGRVVTVTEGQPTEALIRADLLRKS